MARNKVFKNTFMLYLMSFAKLILPLLTMPYLTRVLSEDGYGLMSYVRSYMTYMQLFVDFGFILSSVKDIVKAGDDKKKIGTISGNTILAKAMLAVVAAVVMLVICLSVELLRENWLFVMLSFIGVATSILLLDFLFRGIEKMQYITLIFFITKTITTALTFALVRSDDQLLWIPILEILANVISAVISIVIIKRLGIRFSVTSVRDCLYMIKDSFSYFLSNMATTAFSALNTLIIGIYITDLAQVAHWSLCLSMITAIQGLYAPICNGVYPHMIKEKSLKFIHKTMLLIMPLITLGCIFSFIIAKQALYLVGDETYMVAAPVFRCMIPILFFSFPAQLYGWPTLGAIGKVKETTISTVVSAVVQVVGLVVLIAIGRFNLITLALLRSFTEFCLMAIRMGIVYANRKSFVALPK